jgi:glutamine amidotransferase
MSLAHLKNDPKIPNQPHIGLIDSCGGNLTSLTEALKRLEVNVSVSSDPTKLASADGIILPGVGAARESMERLSRAGLVDFLKEWEKPLLGICIGMQILFSESEEGICPDGPKENQIPVSLLGKIPGRIRKISALPGYPVPHMGFNDIHWEENSQKTVTLAKDLETDGNNSNVCFYFVHSFCAPPGPWVLATAEYGQKIPAVIQWKQAYGVQFHPEKSQKTGLLILRNFVRLCVSSQQ